MGNFRSYRPTQINSANGLFSIDHSCIDYLLLLSGQTFASQIMADIFLWLALFSTNIPIIGKDNKNFRKWAARLPMMGKHLTHLGQAHCPKWATLAPHTMPKVSMKGNVRKGDVRSNPAFQNKCHNDIYTRKTLKYLDYIRSNQ